MQLLSSLFFDAIRSDRHKMRSNNCVQRVLVVSGLNLGKKGVRHTFQIVLRKSELGAGVIAVHSKAGIQEGDLFAQALNLLPLGIVQRQPSAFVVSQSEI